MELPPPLPTASSALPAAASADFWRRARVLAFWSVAVGVVLELLLLGLSAGADRLPGGARAVAQVASKVSWSFVVCLGISSGLAAIKSRAQLMGLLGLVSGPVGFAVARSVHKGTLQALSSGALPAAPDLLSPFLLAGIKAVEYGIFGLWLGRISLAEPVRLARYLRAGALVGAAFCALVLMVFLRAKPEAEAIELVSKGLNEFLFPVGCALVLCVTRKLSQGAASP